MQLETRNHVSFRKFLHLDLLFITFFILLSCIESSPSENRCDTTTMNLISTPCINCWQNRKVNCPAGAKKITRGTGTRGCTYEVRVGAVTRPARGCSHTCRQLNAEQRCCKGYWGHDCLDCPKDSSGTICSGKGTCSDGVEGNGTCTCQGNLAGAICETCSQAQFYGPLCQSICACVHGTCDNGINGTGSCSCTNGYGGKFCDQVLTECSTMNCHENAACLNTTGTVACHCATGYTGDGTTCAEINPCTSGVITSCHTSGHCIHTGPNQSECECNDGYSGDGLWCSPIDPCQTNKGGCPVNSTTCHFDGPNQSHCECNYGFENFITGIGCSITDVCGKYKKTTCDPISTCQTIVKNSEITVKCQCPLGFIERFRTCYADLLTELDKQNQTGPFQNRLNLAIALFKITYKELLFTPDSWTLFVPLDEGFPHLLRSNLSGDPLWKTRARAHIVAGSIHINFTESSAKTVYPLLGYDYPIKALRPGAVEDHDQDDDSAGYFATMKFGGRMSAKILVNAKFASNGLYYIIDTLLEPPDQQYFVSDVGVLDTIQRTPGLGGFMHFISKSFAFRRSLLEKSSYSVFAPTSEALSDIGSEEYKYLNGPMGTLSLNALLHYHQFTEPTSMLSLARVKRIRNDEIITINVSESDGLITVGNEMAKILMSEISVNGGNILIYMIDKLLIPDILKPLVSNRCNLTTMNKIKGECGHCGRSLCPSGGAPIEDEISTCVYNEIDTSDGVVRIGMHKGCQRMCIVNVTTQTCCPGFYGIQCRSCPGPTHQSCNDRGLCTDGDEGTGICSCSDGFTGFDCSKCVNATKYGPNCHEDCLCLNGNCKNTIDSHGECVPETCLENWVGENCDRLETECGNGSITCHQYASCIQLANGTETCKCDGGYVGTGKFCYEHNPCEDVNWGGCDVNAYCLHLGGGRTACECPPNYSGDGYTCTPIDPCSSRDKGGCSENGQCIFIGPGKRECECQVGYRGDGVFCEGINLCQENNGQCHQRARCIFTGPGTRECRCFEGYEGDGFTCLGSVLQEIALRSDLSQIHTWITKWTSIRYTFMDLDPGFTCFLPEDEAWSTMSFDDRQFWINDRHLPYLVQYHMIPRKLSSTSLMSLIGKSLTTKLTSATIIVQNITVDISDTSLPDNMVEQTTLPTLSSSNAKMLVADLPTSKDGIMHIIDSVLLPPRDVVKDYSALSALTKNVTGTNLEPYSRFLGLFVSSGVIDQVEDSGSAYTLFVAPNTAENFPLANATTEEVLTLLRYHVIPAKLIRAVNIKSGQHESTMGGPGYKVTLIQSHGTIMVNGQAVSVAGIRTSIGIIHGLSENLLVPTKSRCDQLTTENVKTTCLPCSYPNTCLATTRLISTSHCMYNHMRGGEIKTTVGCLKNCAKDVVIPKCCPGFYGAGCDPCPGGVGNVCSGFGTCKDSMKGNGTCTCSNSKYDGPACSECAAGRYGPDCDQVCKCINGTCSSGKSGSGACVCQKGYRGLLCNQPVDPNDTCRGRCHSAANCIPTAITGAGTCQCIAGYTGDGQTCNAVNLCEDGNKGGCSEYAVCKHLGPGLRQCVCQRNYEGDGIYCSPINRCVGSYENECDGNAYCVPIGANRSNCICNTGYEGDGKSCGEVDLCKTDNGGCSVNARCKKIGPGERECSCLKDYVGNGFNCTGSISTYIVANPGFEWFTIMERFMSQVPHALNSFGPIIALLPPQDTITRLPKTILSSREHTTQLYLNHIIGCATMNLSRVSQVRTFAGNLLNITMSGSNLKVNQNISILGYPLKFWNGLLYRIDAPILPIYFSQIRDDSNATLPPASTLFNFLLPYNVNLSLNPLDVNTKTFLDRGFTWVSTLFNKSSDLPLLNAEIHHPWTFLLPSDDAFNSLPAQKIRSIIGEQAYASEYMRYHMIRETFTSPIDIAQSRRLKTMQGSDIQLGCAKKSDVMGEYEISGGATVTSFRIFPIRTAESVHQAAVYVIDKVLMPPSIGGRCDDITNVTIRTECSLCFSNRMQKCPDNTKQVSKTDCRVAVMSSTTVTILGCQLVCAAYNVTHQCCQGFYGSDCHACPGAQTPCSGNGNCDDGINGTGICNCKEGFTGTACERCNSFRYGRNCIPCLCSSHGTCNEGIIGDGMCYCDSGWTGNKCDEKTTNTSICKQPCHKNGYCVQSGTCRCKPGYMGDGVNSCEFMDMCQVDNGGCSPYSVCSTAQEKVVCKCLPNFVGDGYFCEGYDPCSTTSTGCHPLARCVYIAANTSRCECQPGYQGDGIATCGKGTTPLTCATNNGGCSGNALCTDVRPTSPGAYPTSNCKCKVGYVGDGYVCHGTVLQVISETFEMRAFSRQLRKQPPRMRRKLDSLTNDFTLFVPTEMTGYASRWRPLPLYDINRHMVEDKLLYYKDLTKMTGKDLIMRSGDQLPIEVNASNILHINGIAVRKFDIVATNGVLHIIDSFIRKKRANIPPAATTASATANAPVTGDETTKSISNTGMPVSQTTAVTVKHEQPIDGGGVSPTMNPLKPVATSGGDINTAPAQSSTTGQVTPPRRVNTSNTSSKGVKIGVSVLIVILILIGVGFIYWKKNRHSYVFRPFTEQQRLASSSDPAEEELFSGLNNPAYDSTGFNTTDTDDIILTDADVSTATALMQSTEKGTFSFENPSTS